MYKVDALEIMKRLPHRYPFLLIDRVLEVQPGKYGKGLKNITINEPYFQGHFPERPIVPGILLIEMLAQMAALVYTATESEDENAAEKVGYIAKIEEVKFIDLVQPGDQLIIEVENNNIFGNFIEVRGKISSENKVVVKGKLIVTQMHEKS
ncbi:MAG: 3-hydroxyacyl-ACP dehydratase FabZ [Clostridiaceae bacterium]|nr:3-hydroxyacyl-ACP dehydratase FabZ [Clostridiaceae bacterium]